MTLERRKFVIAMFFVHRILLGQLLLKPEKYISKQADERDVV